MGTENNTTVTIDTVTVTKNDQPKEYNVVLLTDNFTHMDFVIFVLTAIFNKTVNEAERLTMMVHTQGEGIAGTYSYEIATTKATETINLARSYGYEHFKVRIDELDG